MSGDAWSLVVCLLADPLAGRMLIERLQQLPAEVRRLGCRNDAKVRKAAAKDYEHAQLWKALAREEDRQ